MEIIIPLKNGFHLNNKRVNDIKYFAMLKGIHSSWFSLSALSTFLKRRFDFLFSIIIILLILSWLTPLLAFLIRMESKVSIIFKQRRHGLYGQEFYCFKFRSMVVNKSTDDLHVKKYDMRVTKVGKFIRKTSLDEMPQFYNVF